MPWWLRRLRIRLQCRKPQFDPWVENIPWRRSWQLTPVFLPGNSHGQRSLAGYSPWGGKELDTSGAADSQVQHPVSVSSSPHGPGQLEPETGRLHQAHGQEISVTREDRGQGGATVGSEDRCSESHPWKGPLGWQGQSSPGGPIAQPRLRSTLPSAF